MSAKPKGILQHKAINNWALYLLIAVPISLVMLIAISRTDLSGARGLRSMIQLSVRLAIPWICLAFAASSLHVLFPTAFSRWLLRNRKIIGFCFATAMAWQLLFILWYVIGHNERYMRGFVLSDVMEGIGGYGLLIAMTLTSFRFGRSRLSSKQWKILHTCGMYWLWAYVYAVYWWNLFVYNNPVLLDYIYYWMSFGAWGLRMCAWSKKQLQQTAVQTSSHTGATQSDGGFGRLLLRAIGVALVGVGLVASTFASGWSEQVFNLYDFPLMNTITYSTPYIPFVNFYPIFMIMLGASALVQSRR
jgi:hypothetical protein